MQDCGLPELAEFMTGLWEMVKEYYFLPPDPMDDAYWHDLIETAGELGKKHDSRLCHLLILAFLDYQDEQSKRKKYGKSNNAAID